MSKQPVYFFTSGSVDALKVGNNDRRFMVLDTEEFLKASAQHLLKPLKARYTPGDIATMKRNAKSLKRESGAAYTHTEALDRVARANGHPDWKTLMLNNRKEK